MTKAPDSCRDASCASSACVHLCTDRVVTDNAAARQTTRCCCLVTLINRLVRDALEAECARVAAEEARQWDRATAPAGRKLRDKRIIRIASARAFLAKMTTPPEN